MTAARRIIAYCFAGDYDAGRIPVLDGVRALAVLSVVWFHFWQQSWVFLRIFGISFDWFERCGYLFVDLMLLLSGFCLFLPYARASLSGGPLPTAAGFYRRRAARILPSYYFCILLLLFCFVLPSGGWQSPAAAAGDLLPHLTLTQNLFPSASAATRLNGALWTVAVEVQIYLLFPLLARAFVRRPGLSYLGMTLCGLCFCLLPAARFDALNARFPTGMVLNNTLSFLPVYANGMLGALLYVRFTNRRRRSVSLGVLGTAGVALCIWLFYRICCFRLQQSANAHWQLEWRYPLSLFFLFFLFCLMFSAKPLRRLFDNRLMVFLAGISYNLYIWHQYLSVQLKVFRIPYYSGDIPPNQLYDRPWQLKYLALCCLISLLAAVLTTYLVEKPAARLLLKRRPRS